MIIREGKVGDLDAICEIVDAAREYFKSAGIPQWQGEYPSRADFEADIKGGRSFVAELCGRVVGVYCFDTREDENYKEIYNGSFRSDEPYAAIHRIAVSSDVKGSGIGMALAAHAEESARALGIMWLRGDTHRKNLSMQRMLEKCGFSHCGIIYLEGIKDGEHERFAFDKKL